MSTKTTPRTIQAAAAELTAAGCETHITRDVDLAYFQTGCPSCLGMIPAGAVDWGCYCTASQDELDEANAQMRLICD
jgi:hypothetical protein